MPLPISAGSPALLLRKAAFERTGLTRTAFDEALGLTPDEFRVEGQLVVIGPILEEASFNSLLDQLESAGLVYFEDYFDLGGNWPEWLSLWASAE